MGTDTDLQAARQVIFKADCLSRACVVMLEQCEVSALTREQQELLCEVITYLEVQQNVIHDYNEEIRAKNGQMGVD